MTKSTDELRNIISGWATLSSAWSDTKSKYVEDNVISVLEAYIVQVEDIIDEISMIAFKTEEKLDEIERMGNEYEW